MREAKRWQLRALKDALQQLETIEAWDPQATTGRAWRLQVNNLLADDRRGGLRRARAAAQQAVTLARRPEETYWATRRLTSIDCILEDHQTEIRHARTLMALQPRRKDSLAAMLQAARCNGLTSLARRMEATILAMEAAYPRQQWPAFGPPEAHSRQ